ncbi:MAG: OmpH family outer membrane protein [Saprospiraceae bacterium]|nr:OmpH family outer membrane protein [Saprospiraceae bacterium]
MSKSNYILTALFTLSVLTLHSQKIGYVNSTQLLDQLTIMQEANAELEAIQKKYITDGEAKVKVLESEYRAYMQEANSGNLSQKQMAEKEADLQKKRQEIIDYDTKAKVSVDAQREAIFRPILQQIDQVIQAYGKENGYDYILDSGMGHLLYKPEGEDLTGKIRAIVEQN